MATAAFAAFSVVSLVFVAVVFRSVQARKRIRSEPLTALRLVTPERQRSVADALRNGEPITDPTEAAAVIEAANRSERVRNAIRPIELTYVPLVACGVWVALAVHAHFLLWWFAASGIYLVAARLMSIRRRRRLKPALDAIRRQA